MKPFQKDPFTLMGFHRVLIFGTIVLALLFGVLQAVRANGSILAAALSFGTAAGLVAYLLSVRRKK